MHNHRPGARRGRWYDSWGWGVRRHVAFKARIRAMGIQDRPASYRSPWQNGYVERLIGSIRRECTDHLIVLNAEHLRRILAKYATYYNDVRTHISLGKDAPCRRPIERFGDIVSYPIRKVSEDLRKVITDPDLKKKIATRGSYTRAMSPAEAVTFVQTEQRRWKPVL